MFARLIDKVRRFTCPGLTVAQGGFADVIPRHRDTFLYCDPPYYLDGDSRMFKGIYPQRNFPVHHTGFDHARLRDLLADHRGGFVLSYNDCSTIREWYSGYEIREVAWQYTLGQGETRIGKNRRAQGSDNVKQSHETSDCEAVRRLQLFTASQGPTNARRTDGQDFRVIVITVSPGPQTLAEVPGCVVPLRIGCQPLVKYRFNHRQGRLVSPMH